MGNRVVTRQIDMANCNQERTPEQWIKYGKSLEKILKRIQSNYKYVHKIDKIEDKKQHIYKDHKDGKIPTDEKNEIKSMESEIKRTERNIDSRSLESDLEIFYSLFRPLILRNVIEYYPKIAHCYDKNDFFNDINLLFLELILKYKPKYPGIAYFMFYIKYMISINMIPMIKDILQIDKSNYFYMEDKIDVSKSWEYLFNQDVDNQIYWNSFWNKIREESKKFGKWGEKLIEAYFFSGQKLKINQIKEKYKTKKNLYVIYDKFKRHLRSAMINYAPESVKAELMEKIEKEKAKKEKKKLKKRRK